MPDLRWKGIDSPGGYAKKRSSACAGASCSTSMAAGVYEVVDVRLETSCDDTSVALLGAAVGTASFFGGKPTKRPRGVCGIVPELPRESIWKISFHCLSQLLDECRIKKPI